MAEKNKGGRPTKFTPACRSRFLECIELGMSIIRSANSAGVDYSTAHDWIKQGERDGSGKFYQFSSDYKKAKDKFVEDNLKLIRAAAKGGNKTIEIKTVVKTNSEGVITCNEVTTIKKETAPQWTAAAWKLERIHPEEFSQHKIVDDKTADDMAKDLNDIINS